MITQAELKNLFDYVDGQLVAKTNVNKRKVGDVLGSVNDKGYLKGSVNQRLYRVHRLVFLYFHGFMPTQVDHIDGNRQNNRIENLREATSAQNNQNRMATGASKIKGVVWHKQSKKWVGLTDEEIVSINDQHYNIAFRDFDADVAIARAIEAKLREKNA